MSLDKFSDELNDILVDVYHNILRLEEQTLKKSGRISLSINEMHLIKCVGKAQGRGRTVSELAYDLNIAKPSVTVAVNKLEKKGYVKKTSCQEDGRVVRVLLTREGEKIDAYHHFYHRNMVRSVSDGLTEAEKTCLLEAIYKLNKFFKKSIGDEQ